MNLPAHQPALFLWSCPYCQVHVRTRSYNLTRSCGYVHLYSEHRTAGHGVAPVECMYDPRIQGHNELWTYPETHD